MIGGPELLVLPVRLIVLLAAASVVASYAAARRWGRSDRRRRSRPPERGVVARGGSSRWLGLVLVAGLLVIAAIGVAQPLGNPAPRLLFVVGWLGLGVVSAVAGPVWDRIAPELPAGRRSTTPPGGLVAAVIWVGLGLLAWLEGVPHLAGEPWTALLFVIGYGLVQVLGGLRFGRAWHRLADPLRVYSRAVARMGSPSHSIRYPGESPYAWVAPVTVVIAAALLHLTRGAFARATSPLVADPWPATVAYLVLLGVVAGVIRPLRSRPWSRRVLVPLAVGYMGLQHVPVLATEGPIALQQLVDLVGLDGSAVLIRATVAPRLIAHIALLVFAAGHCMAAWGLGRTTAGQRQEASAGALSLIVISALLGLAVWLAF